MDRLKMAMAMELDKIARGFPDFAFGVCEAYTDIALPTTAGGQ
jgi:hypothetical protein